MLDDALRSGSTTVDREGGCYLRIPPEATVPGDALQSRGARDQLTGSSGRANKTGRGAALSDMG